MKDPYFFKKLLSAVLLIFLPMGISAQQLASADKFINDSPSTQGTKKALSEVFEQLESQFKVRFNFNSDVVENKFVYAQKLEVLQEEKALDQTLEKLLSPLNLVYEKMNQGHYVIYEKAPQKEEGSIIKPISQSGFMMAAATEPITSNELSMAGNQYHRQPVKIAREVSGRVTDENDEPLPGVNIIEKGTTNGTITNLDGQFSLVVAEAATLVFSSVGFTSKEVKVGNQSTINVSMSPDVQQLEEMVVTAFGLEREERSLGTSVGKVSGEQLAQNPEINVANSLAGRVAGVTVDNAGSGPGGSSRVIIRGFSSLGGNNQPLYVVDGVPIDNSNRGAAGRWGGYDRGDGIQNINPNDIENISVLKGPNAAALYGQRGANGVILITTKKGQARQGIGVDINSNVRVGSPLVWPDWQDEYGLGSTGQHRFYGADDGTIYSRGDAEALGIIDQLTPQMTTIADGPQHPKSWGPRMDGSQVYSWDGELVDFSPQPDNARDFFQRQLTFDNSIGLSGGNETTTFRLSLANMTNQGVVPTHELTRNSINLRATHQLSDRFTAEGKINYVRQNARNRPGLSDQQRNVFYQYRGMPRNTRNGSLLRYELNEADLTMPNAYHGYSGGILQPGFTRHWSNATHTEQPYWIINNTINEDDRERVMGFVRLQYEFADWLSISARAGTDFYTDNRHTHDAIGTRVNQIGGLSENVHRFREDNVEVLLTSQREITEDLSASFNVGGNYMSSFFQNVGYTGSRISVPDLYVISNTQVQNPQYELQQQEIQSVFAFGQFSWKDFWYIDWSVRNDWSSTLPEQNNSFAYPSVSSNFIWTDAFELYSDVLSYGAIRASWAQAGNSGDPYLLAGTYSLALNPHLGQPGASFQNSIPFSNLRNELTTSTEIGADIRLFEGRLRLDATWYSSVTENQILNISVAPSAGYASQSVNAGAIKNQGIEAMLNVSPLSTNSAFQWDLSFNFARNRNEVIELVEGVDRFLLGETRNVMVFADPGQPFGAIYTPNARWMRDDDGNRLIGPDGLPIKENGTFMIGNAMPDWVGGISNTLSYKGFVLSGLIDVRKGGEIFSLSNVYEAIYGTTKATLEGRDGTYVAEGVVAQQDAEGEWISTGETSTVQVRAEDYWSHAVPGEGNAVSEEFLNDLTFVKLRELRLGYNFPSVLTDKLGISNLSLSFVGQNLFYFLRRTDGFSPESASYNVNASSLGIEAMAWPTIRSYGLNLRVGL
jgi:TonB-linked SusC/RagA family outer membrane protein